jgi:hypothetical protein
MIGLDVTADCVAVGFFGVGVTAGFFAGVTGFIS